MVFVPKTLRTGLPDSLAAHMQRTWHDVTPFEPDVVILVLDGNRVRRHFLSGAGNWFAENLTTPGA